VRWTNHKTVGLQYGFTALLFLLVGFLLMILMRVQLAWPGHALPSWIAMWLGDSNAPGGIMLPEFYNQLVGMHGTIVVFLAVVPLSVGVRQLARPTADWRAGHGIPAPERRQLLVVPCRRPRDARELAGWDVPVDHLGGRASSLRARIIRSVST